MDGSLTYGLINFYKPLGWTSHDCVAKVRRLLRQKRVGHGGTLDPAATGVLPIAVGQATRLIQFLPEDKAYVGRVRLGWITDTDDLEGAVIAQTDASAVTLAQVEAQLPQFQGTIQQFPPRYSAIQIEGKRLYDRARQGEVFEVPLRTVTVHHIQVLSWQPGDSERAPEIELAIACGPGTYIRSIARDLGAALGVGGTLASLVRTKSCGLALGESLTLEELEARREVGELALLDPAIALQHLEAICLTPALVQRWFYGQRLPIERSPSPHPVRVEDEAGSLLGIGELCLGQNGCPILAPKLVLSPETGIG